MSGTEAPGRGGDGAPLGRRHRRASPHPGRRAPGGGASPPSPGAPGGDGTPRGVGPSPVAEPRRAAVRAVRRCRIASPGVAELAGVRRTRIELRRGRHFRTCTQCSDARTAQARRAHQRREEPSVLILQPTGTPRRRRQRTSTRPSHTQCRSGLRLAASLTAGGRDWGRRPQPEAGTGWDWVLAVPAERRDWDRLGLESQAEGQDCPGLGLESQAEDQDWPGKLAKNDPI